jgi:Cu-Zn family superoxide dismutase
LVLVSALAVALLDPLAVGRGPGAVAQDASLAGSPAAMQSVGVELRDADGRDVGTATVGETPDGRVSIGVGVEGLAPGEHGIHVHEAGVCDPAGDKPFASAGGHYNPTGAAHGGPSGTTREAMGAMGTPAGMDAVATPGAAAGHAGDLGNILVDDDGTGRLQITTDRFRLAELNDADGSALVIHEGRDDLTTDPAGNSGGRIVCGVIFPPQGGGTPMATPTS